MSLRALIIIIDVFICVCITLYWVYKTRKKEKETWNSLENNLHRIGWPEDFQKCRNHMEILKLKYLLPYLSGFPDMKPEDANNSELYTAYKKESPVYLLDSKILYTSWRDNIVEVGRVWGIKVFLRIGFLPGCFDSLPAGGIDIFLTVKPMVEKSVIASYYTPPAANEVEDFNKHFMLMPRNQKKGSKKILLNPDIQLLVLEFRKKDGFLWERTPDELLFPIISIWEEGVAVRTAQTIYNDDLAALVELGERLVEVINKKNFVWAGT